MSDQSQAVQNKVVKTITPELLVQLRKVPILSSLIYVAANVVGWVASLNDCTEQGQVLAERIGAFLG